MRASSQSESKIGRDRASCEGLPSTVPIDRRSKVVFVNRYFFPDQSATSQLLSDLAFGLAKNGAGIHIICSRQRYDEARANLPNRELLDGVTIHRIWTTRFGRSRLAGRAIDYVSFYLSCGLRLFALLGCGDIVVAKT